MATHGFFWQHPGRCTLVPPLQFLPWSGSPCDALGVADGSAESKIIHSQNRSSYEGHSTHRSGSERLVVFLRQARKTVLRGPLKVPPLSAPLIRAGQPLRDAWWPQLSFGWVWKLHVQQHVRFY